MALNGRLDFSSDAELCKSLVPVPNTFKSFLSHTGYL